MQYCTTANAAFSESTHTPNILLRNTCPIMAVLLKGKTVKCEEDRRSAVEVTEKHFLVSILVFLRGFSRSPKNHDHSAIRYPPIVISSSSSICHSLVDLVASS
uniref:Uncharacterized protein n=1 Tax=Glossina austeni TaxID=7395 RepID=A0A1A9VDY2_GLOAU